MSFAAPEPIIIDESMDCIKCGLHVKRTRVESWKYHVCPNCYEHRKVKPSVDNSNPLDTIVTTARINPFTMYLNWYTPFEMRSMK